MLQSTLASFTMHALKLYNFCYKIKKSYWDMYVSCIVNYARVDCINIKDTIIYLFIECSLSFTTS
jgi:hypothetical protein